MSKRTVQNKCMVSKRSAWSKDVIIKITQFVDDLIQETEPGFKSSAFCAHALTFAPCIKREGASMTSLLSFHPTRF